MRNKQPDFSIRRDLHSAPLGSVLAAGDLGGKSYRSMMTTRFAIIDFRASLWVFSCGPGCGPKQKSASKSNPKTYLSI
jgi:hypothetical protein